MSRQKMTKVAYEILRVIEQTMLSQIIAKRPVKESGPKKPLKLRDLLKDETPTKEVDW